MSLLDAKRDSSSLAVEGVTAYGPGRSEVGVANQSPLLHRIHFPIFFSPAVRRHILWSEQLEKTPDETQVSSGAGIAWLDPPREFWRLR